MKFQKTLWKTYMLPYVSSYFSCDRRCQNLSSSFHSTCTLYHTGISLKGQIHFDIVLRMFLQKTQTKHIKNKPENHHKQSSTVHLPSAANAVNTRDNKITNFIFIDTSVSSQGLNFSLNNSVTEWWRKARAIDCSKSQPPPHVCLGLNESIITQMLSFCLFIYVIILFMLYQRFKNIRV